MNHTFQSSNRFVLIENKFINIEQIKYVEVDSGGVIDHMSIEVHFTTGLESLCYSGKSAQQLITFLLGETQTVISSECLLSDRASLIGNVY